MPILVTLPAPVDPGEQPGGGTSTPRPPEPFIPRKAYRLRNAAGHEIGFTGLQEGFILLPGMTGHQMPPVALSSDPMPSQDGSAFRGIRYGERDLFVPMALVGADPNAVTVLRRQLEQLVSRRNGPITVTVQHADGETRWVTGYYVDGAQGDEGTDQAGRMFEKRGIRIRCLDPWWYTEQREQSWRLLLSSDPFISASDAFFPLNLSSSTVAGEATVWVDGDTTAEPIWEITGPATTVTVSANGHSWTYNAAIAGGTTVRVDARRFLQTVTNAATGANLFQNLAANPDLWLLEPGQNVVAVAMPGATADSQVRVSWAPRYETAG